MVRNYIATKRPSDPQREKNIDAALEELKEGKLSLRKIARKYKLSPACLTRQKKQQRVVGRPTALSQVEEELLAQLTDDVAEWSIPVGRFEVTYGEDLLDKKIFLIRRML